MASIIVLIVLFTVVIPMVKQGGRLPRDIGRRMDQLTDQLEARDDEVEALSTRVAEVENRLDFAERLIADHRSRMLETGAAEPSAPESSGGDEFRR